MTDSRENMNTKASHLMGFRKTALRLYKKTKRTSRYLLSAGNSTNRESRDAS